MQLTGFSRLLLPVGLFFSLSACQAQDAAPLLNNGNFAINADGDKIPDGWTAGRGNLITLESDNGVTFVRLVSQKEGDLVRLVQTVKVPEGAKGFLFWSKYRCKNVQFLNGFMSDGRTIFKCLDAEGKYLRPAPPDLIFATNGNKGTTWFERDRKFIIPDGTATMEVALTINRAKSGTLDIMETRLTVLPQADVDEIVAAQAAAKAEKERIANETTTKRAEDAIAVEAMLKLPNKSKELKVQGNQLVTSDGKPILLQGANVPSMEWSAKGEYVLQSVKQVLVDWKANVVRLPVNDTYWFGRPKGASRTEPPAVDEAMQTAYRKLVDDAVAVAGSQGAYLILDLHRYMAPDNVSLEFWKDAAARYKNNPTVLFDLYNEPHSVSWEIWRNGGTVTPKGKNSVPFESPGMQRIVEAVRATGANNVIVAGGLSYALDLSGILDGFALEEKGGNGIMYAIHFYNWHGGWEKRMLPIAEKYPLLVGEFGADEKKMGFVPANKQEDPHTWVPDALGFIQKHKLNWTGFCIHPAATPRMIKAWNYEPTPFWGQYAKDALAGKMFELGKVR